MVVYCLNVALDYYIFNDILVSHVLRSFRNIIGLQPHIFPAHRVLAAFKRLCAAWPLSPRLCLHHLGSLIDSTHYCGLVKNVFLHILATGVCTVRINGGTAAVAVALCGLGILVFYKVGVLVALTLQCRQGFLLCRIELTVSHGHIYTASSIVVIATALLKG